jgi:cobyrinic acid a,c-diamide synthase
MGGGMLLLLSWLQDTLGRTWELAGVIPAQGEILWDLKDPVYVHVSSLKANHLAEQGEKLLGWVFNEVALTGDGQTWQPPLALRGAGTAQDRHESFGTDSLLCSPVMVHFAANRRLATRFVERCVAYASGERAERRGTMAAEQ